MKKRKEALTSILQGYFNDYLPNQRGATRNTLSAYRDAWRLFLLFLQNRHGVAPAKMTVDQLRSNDVLAFLTHVENARQNSARTRNARLTAIRGAVSYALTKDPTLPLHVHQIVDIPSKRTPRRQLGYLERDEVKALLATPDVQRWSGRRDRVLLESMYATGARVTEMVTARVDDVSLAGTGQILIHGKGRKERVSKLGPEVTRMLRDWIAKNGYHAGQPLFPNARGGFLSRSGVFRRIRSAQKKAVEQCPSLAKKSIAPHTLRHTTAMHMLESGIDITVIAMCLGHERIETTNLYVTSSMKMKEKALGALQAPEAEMKRFEPGDELLAFLESI